MGAVKACMKQAFPFEKDLDNWYATADIRPGSPVRKELEEKVADQMYRANLRSGFLGGVQKGLAKFGPMWRDHWGNNALMVMLWGMLDPRPVPRESKAQEAVALLALGGVAIVGPESCNGKVQGPECVWETREDPWLVVLQGKEGFRDNRTVRADEKIKERCREEACMWERCMLRTQCLLRASFIGPHLQLPSYIRRAATTANKEELRGALKSIEATGLPVPVNYPSPSAIDLYSVALRQEWRTEHTMRKETRRSMLLEQEGGPTATLGDLPLGTRFEWVVALPHKLREEYLNTLEQEERAALVAAALKSEEEHSDKLRLQAEAQWDDLSDEQRAKYEAEAQNITGKFSLPSPFGEAAKAIQAIFMFGYAECGRVFESVEDAYPEWILKALQDNAPTTAGTQMTEHWTKGLCSDVKLAVAQPMLPLYLAHAGLVPLDVIGDAVDAMLIDTAEGYAKPTNVFADRQVDDYLKMCLVVTILGNVPEHCDTVKEWVDDYFSGKWIALFKEPDTLDSSNDWFQAAVGPNTSKMNWIRAGLTKVQELKGWGNATNV